MPGVYSIREHEPFRSEEGLGERDLNDLRAFARSNQFDQQDNYRPVLQFDRSDGLRAGNYVGIITTKRRNIVEILPKIDLGGRADPDDETTRSIFLKMLRASRRLQTAARFRNSAIRAMRRFPMLDVFVRLFLDNLGLLVRGGLSRRYVRVEENLPYLRGRYPIRGPATGEPDQPGAVFRGARRIQHRSPRQPTHSQHRRQAEAGRAK